MTNKISAIYRIVTLLFSILLTLTNINAQVKGLEVKEGKWKLVNSTGVMIGTAIYDNMGDNGIFSEGLLAVTLKKKSGYIDSTGKVIIPMKYDGCNTFKFGTATVWVGDFCGLIDKNGKILLPIKYSLIEDSWDDDKVAVSIYNKITGSPKYGLFTRKGIQLLPVSYKTIEEMEPLVSEKKPAVKTTTEREVLPGLIMELPNSFSLTSMEKDLKAYQAIFQDGRSFLYFERHLNQDEENSLTAMTLFRNNKLRGSFVENGTINYSSPSKIVFSGFYGFTPASTGNYDSNEGYVYFSKPGKFSGVWVFRYVLDSKDFSDFRAKIVEILQTARLK